MFQIMLRCIFVSSCVLFAKEMKSCMLAKTPISVPAFLLCLYTYKWYGGTYNILKRLRKVKKHTWLRKYSLQDGEPNRDMTISTLARTGETTSCSTTSTTSKHFANETTKQLMNRVSSSLLGTKISFLSSLLWDNQLTEVSFEQKQTQCWPIVGQ